VASLGSNAKFSKYTISFPLELIIFNLRHANLVLHTNGVLAVF